VAGVRHRLAGQGPEDSFAWAHRGEWLAVAVADGVGSVAGSAGAAGRACLAAVGAGLHAVEEGSAEEAVAAAISAANEAARGGGAATVAVAVLRRDGTGGAGRVGDSTAFLVVGEEAEELFTPPDPERADAGTAAVPDPDIEPETVALAVPAGAVLVLATDGVADPWRDGPTTAGPALVAGLSGRPGPVELLLLADFSRHGCHDDRTLLCVWAAG
jgi:serine/threonine protein phosphatase PrpC